MSARITALQNFLWRIGNDICDIVSQAKRVSTTGHVSGITPRSGHKDAAEKGKTVNTVIESVAGESGCLFMNHQDNFLCRNGDIIEEMLTVDGLHLSKQGTIRLIDNLKLQSAACCYIGRSARPGEAAFRDCAGTLGGTQAVGPQPATTQALQYPWWRPSTTLFPWWWRASTTRRRQTSQAPGPCDAQQIRSEICRISWLYEFKILYILWWRKSSWRGLSLRHACKMFSV